MGNKVGTEATLKEISGKIDDVLLSMEETAGIIDQYAPGLCVDFANKTFERIGAAVGLNKGTDFDKFFCFGGRKRCNVDDDGAITAYYGDADFAEDGSNGQVMVYQPAFYYKVEPLDFIETERGTQLNKVNYYVSDRRIAGFKKHPAFTAGGERNYILFSAYEGSIYDESAAAYLTADEQVANFATDKLSSISGAKPASGLTQNLTRANTERLATNRGNGWHCDFWQSVAANQLLMAIEAGTMNTQNAYGQGVVSKASGVGNEAHATGETSALGNASGEAEGTSGKRSLSYRGMENPYGNIYKWVEGINVKGDGTQNGGVVYACDDLAFSDSKFSDNYAAVFEAPNTSAYISAFGYDEENDALLFPIAATGGNSSLPVGDYVYFTTDLNGTRVSRLGSSWDGGATAGAFYWNVTYGAGYRRRYIGGRLVYAP